MKTILILLDTLRRDNLKVYNEKSNVKMPNISKLAEQSTVFNNHYVGSMPCMPARRDLFTGRLDFFERGWGGLEPFDKTLPDTLNKNNVLTHMITDHHHYFRTGGEGYVQQFKSWEFFRGQESDPWVSHIDNYQMNKETAGRVNLQYQENKTRFKTIDDYPTMKTFNSAVEFVERNKGTENFLLCVEGFDPHEPFYSPKEFTDMYGIEEDNIKYFYESPQYGVCKDTPEQLDLIRRRYKANASFADYAVGKLIDKLKDLEIYDDVQIILTTDHGFHLGEHGVIGKGINHLYNEVAHIPLLIKKPNQKKQVYKNQLTQNIDIMPTLLEDYNVDQKPFNFHGKSLNNIINNNETNHETIVYGYNNQSVAINDGNNVYFRGKDLDVDCYAYTAMPTTIKGYYGGDFIRIDHSKIEMGRFLKRTNYPVFKFPFNMPKFFIKAFAGENLTTDQCYKISDEEQLENVLSEEKTKYFTKILRKKMEDLEVPEEQYLVFKLN